MIQLESPRLLTPLLVSAEVQAPDLCHQIAQVLLSPWLIGFGYSYRVDQGVHALPDPSLAKRVAVVALAIILWPLTLLATVLGGWISGLSTTYRKAYGQIQDWNIGVAWQNDKPEITSRRLTLRPIKEEDLPTYQALFSNAHAVRYAEGDLSNLTEQFQNSLNRWEEHPYGALAVVDRESGRVIGHAALGMGDFEGEEAGWADLSVLIDPAYRNEGFDEERATEGRAHIGLEVSRMLVTYARSLQERGVLVPAHVRGSQQNLVTSMVNVHHNARGAVDWVCVPLTSIRASVHRHDIAARRIGERLIQEIGARRSPVNTERDDCITEGDDFILEINARDREHFILELDA